MVLQEKVQTKTLFELIYDEVHGHKNILVQFGPPLVRLSVLRRQVGSEV